MDQDETCRAGRPWPQPHCVRWGSSSPPRKGAQQTPTLSKFTGAGFACICIIHCPCLLWPTAGWIKMPFGTEVGLGPGHIVLDGDPAPPLPKQHRPPPILGPCLLRPNGRPSQLLLSTCANQCNSV